MTPSNPAVTRYSWLILFVLVVFGIGAFAYLMLDQPDPIHITINPPAPTATHTPTSSPEPTPIPALIEVYVTGAVEQPESRLSLPPESRVQDAIEAAGGALTEADLSRVNLAGQLLDGDHIHVPAKESGANPAPPTPNAPRLVNLNTATQAELETLPEIGPATAAEIVRYREANGPFRTLDDFDQVPGIGPATIEKIESLVTFE